jgi:hypothetical protein
MKTFLSLLLCALAAVPSAAQTSPNRPDRSLSTAIAQRWWESAAGVRNVTLKDDTEFPQLSLEPKKAEQQLLEFKEQGFTGVQVFAPADGGKSYNGLDARDHYRIEPKYGSIEDFKGAVQLAHRLAMPVVVFTNLGYSALDAPAFLKACDDEREGRDSRERKWFLWSDSSDALPPTVGDTYFMVRPTWLAGYQPLKTERWVYSERARHYYWTRWPGEDAQAKKIDLPQYNWLTTEWQEEAAKIVRFWMDTGADGLVVDAVNWYVGYTWEKGRQTITDIIRSYGNKYSQPEGGGGFHEDPVAWITDGGWVSVQDYGLNLWWEKPYEILKNAVEAGDPRPIEESLQSYHDRVVAVGGTLNMTFPRIKTSAGQHLAAALVAATGQLITDWSTKRENIASDPEIQWLLKTKAAHPALFQMGLRRKLPTRNEAKHYAFLRTARDASERILIVTNFANAPETVELDASGLSAESIQDLKTGQTMPVTHVLKVSTDGQGYRFFILR